MHEYGTMVKVKLRPIRRVACDGFAGSLWASPRPCFRPSCICNGGDESNGNRHVFSECTTSVYTKCQQIQLEPRSVVDPSPMRGELEEIGNRLTLRAAVGDFMAVETQSDETAFWLVQVSAAAQDVPPDYRNEKVKEAIFEFKRNSKAVKVLRLKPCATPRGGNSMTVFELDSSLGEFFVPGHLVRVGKLPLLKQLAASPARAPGRSGRQAPSPPRFEISTTNKARVLELCRIFD